MRLLMSKYIYIFRKLQSLTPPNTHTHTHVCLCRRLECGRSGSSPATKTPIESWFPMCSSNDQINHLLLIYKIIIFQAFQVRLLFYFPFMYTSSFVVAWSLSGMFFLFFLVDFIYQTQHQLLKQTHFKGDMFFRADNQSYIKSRFLFYFKLYFYVIRLF
jgi:hypothetical protein